MKTLRAAEIAKLVAKKKVLTAVELLCLIGPDTDLIILLKALQDIRNNNEAYGSDWRSQRGILDEMIKAVFGSAALHYPAAAEEYLRGVDNENELSRLSMGEESPNSCSAALSAALDYYRKSIGEPVTEPPEDEAYEYTGFNIDSIISRATSTIFGKVVWDTYVPQLKKFFQDKPDVYIEGGKNVLLPFTHILSRENILGKLDLKKSEEDKKTEAVSMLYSDQDDSVSITNRAGMKRLFTGEEGGKKTYKMIPDPSVPQYNTAPIKDWFLKLTKIKTIINISTPKKRREQEGEGNDESELYPTFLLTVTFNPRLLNRIQKDKDGLIYAVGVVLVTFSVGVRDGYYVPLLPKAAQNAFNIQIQKGPRNSKYTGYSYNVTSADFRNIYGPQVRSFITKILTEGKDIFKTKAPRLVLLDGDIPLVRQMIMCKTDSIEQKAPSELPPAVVPPAEGV